MPTQLSTSLNGTKVLTIVHTRHVATSDNLNPTIRVVFSDDTFALTKTDASVGYSIEAPEFFETPVRVDFDKGRIVHVSTTLPKD